MLHLSELHGGATHLAVVAVPVYAIVLVLRRLGRDHQTLRHVEPWLLGAALLGMVTSGVTGLLVWGEAQTVLRGQAFRLGTAHFWLGIALAVVLVGASLVRYLATRRGRPTHGALLLATGVVALALVAVQGYLGGRMTYDRGVGVEAGGEFGQTAIGTQRLNLALARGTDPIGGGKQAFSTRGLGCARCHGNLAQGLRGPPLGGGIELRDFRGVHGGGLFPASVVTDRDFRAVDAWLRTLPERRRDAGG